MKNQSQPLKIQPEAKFSLGRVVATPGACKAVDRHGTSYSSSSIDMLQGTGATSARPMPGRTSKPCWTTRVSSRATHLGTSGSGSSLSMIVPPPVFFCHASASRSIRHGTPFKKISQPQRNGVRPCNCLHEALQRHKRSGSTSRGARRDVPALKPARDESLMAQGDARAIMPLSAIFAVRRQQRPAKTFL